MRRTINLLGLALTTLVWQSQTCHALRVQLGGNGLRPLQSDVWHGEPITLDQLWDWNLWNGQWNDPFSSDFFRDIFETPRWHHSLLPERHQLGHPGTNCQQRGEDEVKDSQSHGLNRGFREQWCERKPSCQMTRDEALNQEVEHEKSSMQARQGELERLRADNAKRQRELVHEREELFKRQKQIEDELRQREEAKRQQELQMEKQQLEMRRRQEAERLRQEQMQQQAVERQRQKELQEKRQQRELEFQRQRQQELDLQKQRQREKEIQRQRELEQQRKRQRDLELQRERQKQAEERRIRQQEQLRRETRPDSSSTGNRNHHHTVDLNSRNAYQQRQHGQHHQNQHTASSHRNAQQTGQPRVELLSINVKDYDPDDFSISTHGGDLLLEGRHVCRCDEDCFERELERKVKLPRGIDTHSLSATYNRDGVLTIEGEQHRYAVPPKDVQIPVQGVRLHRNTAPCKHLKSGIKLKKMNKSTGEIVDDIPMINRRTRVFENELDGDGVTIETEEYY